MERELVFMEKLGLRIVTRCDGILRTIHELGLVGDSSRVFVLKMHLCFSHVDSLPRSIECEYNPYAVFLRTPRGGLCMKLEHASAPGIQDIRDRLRPYSLLDAIVSHRSRRFARGMKLNGGPLAYDSRQTPEPLSPQEEAALAFAACGVTGYAMAELPYESGSTPGAGGGNIMKQFVGRTVPSADALHTVIVFVINDNGAWMLRRPQDFPSSEIGDLVKAAREYRLDEVFLRSRVAISDRRVDVPRELPFVPPFNKWSANVPGSTYFIAVNELTALTSTFCCPALVPISTIHRGRTQRVSVSRYCQVCEVKGRNIA